MTVQARRPWKSGAKLNSLLTNNGYAYLSYDAAGNLFQLAYITVRPLTTTTTGGSSRKSVTPELTLKPPYLTWFTPTTMQAISSV
ncbi:MAG: hypothetical protein Q8S19_11250 [Bacillota bacterium]|nr:hypothetical protein [Bacillota bacterium]